MKTFIQTACIFIVIVLTIMFMGSQFSNAAVDTELESALDTALEHALYSVTTDRTYTIEDTDQLAADIMHELFASCNTKADYTIAFNVLDSENGLIDVQVTQKVKSFPLIETEVVCRKTILLDDSTE